MSFNNSFKPDFLAETTAMLSMQLSVYSQNTHTISKIKEEENMDFFYNCIGLNATVWPVSTQTDIGTKQTGLESFKLSCFYPIDKSPVSDHWPIMVPHFSTLESTGRFKQQQPKKETSLMEVQIEKENIFKYIFHFIRLESLFCWFFKVVWYPNGPCHHPGLSAERDLNRAYFSLWLILYTQFAVFQTLPKGGKWWWLWWWWVYIHIHPMYVCWGNFWS